MTTSPDGYAPQKLFFSERHVRGWLAAAIILSALIFTARSVYLTIYLASIGDVDHLYGDESIPWIVALYVVAIPVASRRVSRFVLKAGELLAVKLHLTKHASGRRLPATPDDVSTDTDKNLPNNKKKAKDETRRD